MTRRCLICNVYRKPNDEHYFFRFPSNSNERTAWLKAVGKPAGFHIYTNTSICSKHFKAEDFWPRYASGVLSLRPNAIPSLMLEPESDSSASREMPPARKKMRAEILKNEKDHTPVEFDIMEVESDEDEENAVVVSEERKETPASSVKPPSKKKAKSLKITSVKEKNLQFNASILTNDELETVKKDKLPPKTIYRLIVPVPPKGELNTEKIIKQMISGLPQLKALASEPAEPPPLVPMSGAKAAPSSSGPVQAESGADSQLTNCSSNTQSSALERPTILTPADAIDETDAGPLSADMDKPPDTVAPGSTSREEEAEEIHVDKTDPRSSDDSMSGDESNIPHAQATAADRKLSKYKQKIKNLEARLRRMSSKMAVISEQYKTLRAHETLRDKQKSLSDNIIVVHTEPVSMKPGKSKEKRAAGENINSILMKAINQDVPPPDESKYMVANYEKLVSRVTSIKEALKNKDIVNCIVIQTADLNEKD